MNTSLYLNIKIEIIKEQEEIETTFRQDPHISEEIQKHRMGSNINLIYIQN